MFESIRKASKKKVVNEMYKISKEFEPRVAAAFMMAIASIKNKVTLASISRALATGNTQRVIDLVTQARLGDALKGVGIDPNQSTVVDELLGTFKAGGVMGANQLPKSIGLAASLDMTNPATVKFITNYLPVLIREVNKEQLSVVQSVILRGFTEGRTIPMLARDIRDVIGLTQSQAVAVGNFRRQLETGTMGSGSAPWDRRLSAIEQNKAREIYEAPVKSQAEIDALVDRYQASLTNKRALDVSRTEVHRASIEGQKELWRQANNEGLIDTARATRVWIATHDERVRDDHLEIERMNPDGVGWDEPFQTPSGPVMDPSEFTDPADACNCRCAVALQFRDSMVSDNVSELSEAVTLRDKAEKYEHFESIEACMGDAGMVSEFPDRAQRYAVCLSKTK
jgi:hypothetical protein